MSDSQAQGPSTGDVSSAVSIAKDLVGLFRDFSLVLLAILLILFPDKFNDILVRAGFEEGSIVGLKWKKQFKTQDEQLVKAQTTIGELGQKNSELQKALSDLESKFSATSSIGEPQLSNRIAELTAANEELSASVSDVQNSLQATISANSQLVQDIAVSADDTTEPQWAIIFGGDDTHKAALDEILRAQTGGYNAEVFFRQSSYRSVIVFESRRAANTALTEARELSFNKDAYLVNLDNWCPNRKRTQDSLGKYFVCN